MNNIPVCLMKINSEIVLLLTQDKQIRAWKSVEEAVKQFEDIYNLGHARGGGWSTGATMLWMQTQPSIIIAPALDWLKQNILREREEEWNVSGIRGDGINMLVVKTREGASKYWEEGRKPALITKDADLISNPFER